MGAAVLKVTRGEERGMREGTMPGSLKPCGKFIVSKFKLL